MVGLEPRPIGVVVVAHDAAGAIQRPRFKHHHVRFRLHHHVQPCPPGWVGRGKFMPRQIFHDEHSRKRPIRDHGIDDRKNCGLFRKKGPRFFHVPIQILSEGGHGIAQGLEYSRRHEISAKEFMAAEPLARLGQDVGHGHFPHHLGHMAIRAGGRLAKRTFQPFLIGHLFGQPACGVTIPVQGLRDQGVASGAQLGRA